jgi:Lon protease-like protein
MELPLFPLKNVVLFPGMVLSLHIFEPRYREMIGRCIDEKLPFGVVLIEEGQEVGETAQPHMVGTAARIVRVERLDPDHAGGRMNITAIGTQRFRVLELNHSHTYLSGTVRTFPVINGSTRLAADLAQKVRPRILEYVELLAEASGQPLRLDRLPEDPTTLAFLVAIALQINSEDKQKLLEQIGIPEMLAHEAHLLSRESLFTRHMIATQQEIMTLNSGPSGYIFPN